MLPLLLFLWLRKTVLRDGIFTNTDSFCLISGLINIPAVAFGIFSGGLIMKKLRISVLGAAKLSLGSSFFGYLLLLSLFAMGCENSDVAGLTVSYHGYAGKSKLQHKVLLRSKLLGHCIPQSIYCWKKNDWPKYASQKCDSKWRKLFHLFHWALCQNPFVIAAFNSESFMPQVQIIFLITF